MALPGRTASIHGHGCGRGSDTVSVTPGQNRDGSGGLGMIEAPVPVMPVMALATHPVHDPVRSAPRGRRRRHALGVGPAGIRSTVRAS